MFQNKNSIIIIGALAVATLMNMPRFLLLFSENRLARQVGFSLEDLILRTFILFCFSWLVLSYNIKWTNHALIVEKNRKGAVDVIVNGVLLMLGVGALVWFKTKLNPRFLDFRAMVFISFFSYSIVLVVLVLASRFLNLNEKHQQSLLEKERAKQQALHHQLEALRNQINPHFLFNTLNSLNALIRQGSEKAPVFVDKLSGLLRHSLQSSEQDYISLEEEISYLRKYIFLQQERFGEKLEVHLDIKEEWLKEMVPTFSLQLLVENAIKHNIISTRQPLKVEIYGENGNLCVRNIKQKRRDYVESTGKGLTNLSTRFQLLKKTDIEIVSDDKYFLVKLPIE